MEGGQQDDEDDDEDGSEEYENDDDDESSAAEVDTSVSGKTMSVRGKFQPMMTPQEVANRKRELLYQIQRLEAKGIQIPRRLTMSDGLDEIQSEFERLKLDREVDISVRFQRKMLMTCVTGIELLNKTFDPFKLQLNGWSDSMHDSIGDYDEVFEDLHMKYRNRGVAMAPELKLLFMLGGSGVMFHLTSTMFRKANVPGLEQVMRGNPGLMRQFAQATMDTMSPQQQHQHHSPHNPSPTPQSQSQSPSSGNGSGGFGGIGSLIGSLFGGGGGASSPPPAPRPMPPDAPPGSFMRGPTPVADILKDMHRGAFQTEHNLDLDADAEDVFGEFARETTATVAGPTTAPKVVTANRRRQPRKTVNVE
jgi:hypothetical protein